jgi:hypothetical protein
VAAARALFTHEPVAPPVVADFHSAPMSTNQVQPVGGVVVIGCP